MQSQDDVVYKILDKLEIQYVKHNHPAVFTCEEAKRYSENIEGAHCKNLFLRDSKGIRHFLVVLLESTKVDLKKLSVLLGCGKLGFASEERLEKYLGLKPGSVSPFGLVNDKQREVEVILDSGLKDFDKVNFHPNINRTTLTISYNDFVKYLKWTQNKVTWVEFDVL